MNAAILRTGFVVILLLAADLFLLPGMAYAKPWKELQEKKQFRDYVIKVYLTEEGEGRVVISRKGKTVFELKEENGARYKVGVISGDKKYNAEIPVGKDITGRGIPNLVISAWSGGAHCCYTYHILELGKAVRQVAALEVTHAALSHFEDLDNDGKLELVTADFTFAYWKASFAASPAPLVILEYRDGLYRLAGRLMLRPAPSEERLSELAKVVSEDDAWQMNDLPASLWKTMLDLIYTGNADTAFRFADKAWPAAVSGKEAFLSAFRKQLALSPYWVEINRMNATSTYLRSL
jgi:hypothetical protein